MQYLPEKDSYSNLVKKNIEISKLLYNLTPNKQKEILKLINRRDLIRKSNGFLAEHRINKINKKINKIKNNI